MTQVAHQDMARINGLANFSHADPQEASVLEDHARYGYFGYVHGRRDS